MTIILYILSILRYCKQYLQVKDIYLRFLCEVSMGLWNIRKSRNEKCGYVNVLFLIFPSKSDIPKKPDKKLAYRS